MTGYTVHTGSTEKFSEGWDQIFKSGKKPAKKAVPAAAQAESASQAPVKKTRKKK